MIFNIQRYSTHDGPGIRTVVFLKGCSLGCRWCQNPESRARSEDLLYDPRLCLAGCELCQQAAPAVITRTLDGLIIHRQHVNDSHIAALRDCCPTTALTVCGEEKSVEEIMATVLRDKPFYDRSGGGITLSGGEPFMNPDLARALFEASHQAGIHTAVETCLHVPWKYIEPALPFVDLFLADLKHVDEAVFRQWTDGSARRVLDNLQRLAQAGKNMIIRVPLIQGFNASEADITAITDFAADRLRVSEIHFLPYHTLGMNKYQLLSQPYTAPDKPLDAPELLAFAQDYARSKGLTAILRG
ncbi:glycyl-radical enzyme activating protein [Klebsiella quasipneumoniae]|uniref:Glycyl-radical enzyme activating protein n=1 Tax=Klebsiella quasipneumoniae subsp. similipneumoniae TaxID=1463164 RepID=A0AAE4MKQ4_9ENTR|nr:glycyl-radical enzyme activating protein [Klebsiella quasipneumoniae]EIY5136619.1 glycyl-radical enzyme activating protein [Klebsiella quasipneumoniae]EIY5164093.1 glycyl-radical enzyme activating protein [Klebsiella quasipneumoniae]MBL4367770.1 glycyl-radical enzyme activating protein [Klebsiella quasipneumoniae]MBO3688855.1 glycyl-radical enzyme activating protein [Klebsiella quasipneumoniae subsp. similipneumoniae]MBQ5209498.1 glycyl-radical enzyme activating protein [Klebsiella quasipne